MHCSRAIPTAYGGILSSFKHFDGYVFNRSALKLYTRSFKSGTNVKSGTSWHKKRTQDSGSWKSAAWLQCAALSLWSNISNADASNDRNEKASVSLKNQMAHLTESSVFGASPSKPQVCTADELHYVKVGGGWKLALWRYKPEPSAPTRNHPILLLSGVGTNALGFDLDPSVSMARHMAAAGFDTWILEVRGAGLSKRDVDSTELPSENGTSISQNFSMVRNEEKALNAVSVDKAQSSWKVVKSVKQLSSKILNLLQELRDQVNDSQSKVLPARFAEEVSSILEDAQLLGRFNEIKERLTAILEEGRKSAMVYQLSDLTNRLTGLLEDAQNAVTPRVSNIQEQLTSTVDDLQKFIDMILKYDWDFDNFLEDDIPLVIEYIRGASQPKDGKLLSVGHSMGGIVLYTLLATHGERCGLKGVITLASSLDYGVSDSCLKFLVPLADPAQILNVPVIPLGAVMTAVYPLIARPPYVFSWVGENISANGMMDPDLFKKLVLNNFCTISAKLILQLATVFQPGGLKSRDGSVTYKSKLHLCSVPVLALAGDKDLVCPPAAVIDTLNCFPKQMATYKVFGGKDGRHYGHYDLVCAPQAKKEVFPVILEFLIRHDSIEGWENEKA